MHTGEMDDAVGLVERIGADQPVDDGLDRRVGGRDHDESDALRDLLERHVTHPCEAFAQPCP